MRTATYYATRLHPHPIPVPTSTSGLLLFTDDGLLNEAILWPGRVSKVYEANVKLREPTRPSAEQLQRLLDGVDLADGFARAQSVEVIDEWTQAAPTEKLSNGPQVCIAWTVCEMAFHRMCLASVSVVEVARACAKSRRGEEMVATCPLRVRHRGANEHGSTTTTPRSRQPHVQHRPQHGLPVKKKGKAVRVLAAWETGTTWRGFPGRTSSRSGERW